MAFTEELAVTAVSISEMAVILKTDPADPDGPQESAHFRVSVVRSDGSIKQVKGDLVPHITVAQRSGLLDFMAALRTQAETEIL